MRVLLAFPSLGLLLALLGVSHDAEAQARYSCRQANGSFIQSDRPCVGTGLTYYPQLATPSTNSGSYVTRSGDAPEHLLYMNPRCSAMNDAIRTSSVRGLSYQAAAELRRNYQQECAENENEARDLLRQQQKDNRQAKNDVKRNVEVVQQQTQMAQQQCDESKRIIASKKRRTDLNEGERGELQRFEANIRVRCG